MLQHSNPRARILVAITTWGAKNDKYLSRLIAEYRAMSFDVDIVVISNVEREAASGVEVVVVNLEGKKFGIREVAKLAKHPWTLLEEYREWKRHMDYPFLHKRIFTDRVNEYDLFVFSEDDTLITEKNLRSFLEVSAALPENEVPGFLRYEDCPDGDRNYPEVHGIYHWDPQSIRKRESHTLAFFTNEHSACYVLTQKQLRRAIDSGGFLVPPHSERYDLLCTAATDPYTQCGLRKLICISRLDDFLINHLPAKYIGTPFGVSHSELRRQVDVLLKIGQNGHRPAALFQTETKLNYGMHSKSYYEPVRPEVISAIPTNAKSVLSIGCGWGATEALLAEKGVQVTAVPLDPVIPGGAEARGVEIITGDLAEVRNQLAGRQFDCLLALNVLHLVPNPVELLSSFGSLLSPGGVVVTVVPNTTRLGAGWKRTQSEGRTGRQIEFENMGIQLTSRKTIQSWFHEVGLTVEKFQSVIESRARTLSRLSMGLTNSWIASEFIAVARKVPVLSRN